ncbi:MAG: zinc ribbon domain-containing protein [Sporolactobacillus sp.]
MSTFLVTLLIIAVFVGVFLLRYLTRKGVHAAATAANKHLIFRQEYQTEQQLLSEHLTFETRASIPEIRRRLTETLAPVDKVPVVGAAVYVRSQEADRIVYAYGSHLMETCAFAVGFSRKGDTTQSTFKFLRWKKRDGMLLNSETLKSIRQKVWNAFQAADPSVRVTGSLKSSTQTAAHPNHSFRGWICRCGQNNEPGDAFCGNCGARKPE